MKLSLCTFVTILNTVLVNSKALPEDKILTFWQISDIHFDAFYDEHGDPKNWCHYHNNESININSSLNITDSISYEFNLGKYGDFECESNWDLLISAFEMMQSQNGDPGTKYKQIISVPTILKLFVICPLLRLLVENMFKFCLKLDLSL